MSSLIRPLYAGEAFLADVRAAPGPLDLWWLGQSGFLVAWEGRHLLLDPYLSDSLTRKYADTDKPHVRMTERVVDPARLDAPGLVDDHDRPVALGAGQVAERHDLGVPLARRDLVGDGADRQRQLAEQRVGDVEDDRAPHRLVRRLAVEPRDEGDAAGVVLVAGVVQANRLGRPRHA